MQSVPAKWTLVPLVRRHHLLSFRKGTDFVIFGGQQTEGHGIVALPQKAKELTDLNSFKGKTIATVRLATGDVIFRAALSEAGIDWKNELTINELDSPAAVLEAVKKGSVDAGIVWTPFIKLGEKQGLEIVKYSGELVKMHTCCRQVALSSNVKENKEDFVRFMAALIKAYKFYMENQDETVDIIAERCILIKPAMSLRSLLFQKVTNGKTNTSRIWDCLITTL